MKYCCSDFLKLRIVYWTNSCTPFSTDLWNHRKWSHIGDESTQEMGSGKLQISSSNSTERIAEQNGSGHLPDIIYMQLICISLGTEIYTSNSWKHEETINPETINIQHSPECSTCLQAVTLPCNLLWSYFLPLREQVLSCSLRLNTYWQVDWGQVVPHFLRIQKVISICYSPWF